MADYDRDRAEREYRKNPPKNAPGQASGDEWDIDFDSDMSLTDDSAFMGSDISAGSVLDSVDNKQSGQQNNNSINSVDAPEWEYVVAAWKATKVGAKGFYTFIDAMLTSFKNITEGDWHRLGTRMLRVSLICIAVGLVLLFMKILIPSIG